MKFIYQMSTEIYLNTRDKAAGSTNYDCVWYLESDRLSSMHGFDLRVLTIQLPNAVFPLNKYQDSIKWSEVNGVNPTFTASITHKHYTGTQFAAALQILMNTTSAGNNIYTITYDAQTLGLTISGQFTWKFISTSNDMYQEMGFTTEGMGFLNNQTSNYPINLSGTHYVDVHSNIAAHCVSSSTTGSLLTRIPLTSSFGTLITASPEIDRAIHMNESTMQVFRIQFRDDKGHPWEIPANQHVGIKLLIEPVLSESRGSRRLVFETDRLINIDRPQKRLRASEDTQDGLDMHSDNAYGNGNGGGSSTTGNLADYMGGTSSSQYSRYVRDTRQVKPGWDTLKQNVSNAVGEVKNAFNTTKQFLTDNEDAVIGAAEVAATLL